MEVTLKIGNGNYGDVLRLAKSYARESKTKIKDLGKVELSHQVWGIAMTLFDKNGDFITNVAL